MALRLAGLGRQSLWLDEMTSIQVAQSSLGAILGGTALDNHTPPLYYALLHLWSRLAPLTEAWLRLPGALADGVNMVLLARLGWAWVGRGAAAVLAAYAASPFMVYYAQEGRMYTLAVTFTLAFALALERLLRAGERGAWARGAVAGVWLALGVYTHYYVALVGAALIALALVRAPGRRVRLALLAAGAVGSALLVPWLPVVYRLATGHGQEFRTFLGAVIPYALFRFTVGYAVFPLNPGVKAAFGRAVAAHAAELAAVFGCLLLLAWTGWRHGAGRERAALARGGAVVGGTMVLAAALSLRTPMLSERYLVVVVPFFLLALVGSQDLRRRAPRAALAALCLLLGAGDVAYFANPAFGKAQWRDAARYVASVARAGDVVLVEPDFAVPVFRYYFHGPQPVRGIPPGRPAEPAAGARLVTEALGEHARGILVTSGHATGTVATALARVATPGATRTFPLEIGIVCTTWDLAPVRAAADEIPRP
jgi:mannosyltransferase